MRILYDHQAFTMQTHGGVSRCFSELYRQMPESVEAAFSIHETNNVYAKDLCIGVPRGYDYEHFLLPFHFPFKGRLFGVYNHLKYGMPYQYDNDMYFHGSEYSRQISIRVLQQGNFDVFHPTFFDDYFLPYLNGKPFVLTIHDMIPWIYSNVNNTNWKWQVEKMKNLAPEASAIVAVSENTKKDIIRYLHIPEDKIHVVYHGCSFPKIEDTSFIVHEPYILYVGDRNLYKNFNLFVEEVADVLKRHEELRVVCTGRDFNEKELQQMKKLGISDRFIRKWIVCDDEFYSLYHHAVCFVYTSEYEGFGIPILEAYQADCPVMLNNASCFPEIAGDAAIFFEMKNNFSDFSKKFEELYSMNENKRLSLLKKQRDRLNLYSWKKSALQLTDIYRSII